MLSAFRKHSPNDSSSRRAQPDGSLRTQSVASAVRLSSRQHRRQVRFGLPPRRFENHIAIVGRAVALGEARQQLYVDPQTGLLCRKESRILRRRHLREQARLKQAEVEARPRLLSPSEQLHREDGLWYNVRLGRLPDARRIVRYESGRLREKFAYEKRWDVLRRAEVSSRVWTAGLELYGRRGAYAASKRQLGRQELRRYGLK